MPGITGLETLTRLDKKRKGQPVIGCPFRDELEERGERDER